MNSTTAIDAVRFPVGDFAIDPEVTPEKRRRWIRELAEAPAIRSAVVIDHADLVVAETIHAVLIQEKLRILN